VNRFKELDIATRIQNLSVEIKCLVELFDIDKVVVVKDFSDLINSNLEVFLKEEINDEDN